MTIKTHARCPDCGAALDLDRHAETDVVWFCPNPGGIPTLERRRRPAEVLACSGCEYVVERPTTPQARRSR